MADHLTLGELRRRLAEIQAPDDLPVHVTLAHGQCQYEKQAIDMALVVNYSKGAEIGEPKYVIIIHEDDDGP